MGSQAAPGQLEDLRQFVNTRDLDLDTEKLESPEALSEWLAERDLLVAGTRVGQRDLEQAIELRETLRELLLENNGAELDPKSIEALNDAVSGATLSVHFDTDGSPTLAVAGSGTSPVIGPLVAIVYEAMVAGTWSRLKACRADDCNWAFYDRSKNHSGTWCAMRVCGNRAKVRAYRERRRSAKPSSS